MGIAACAAFGCALLCLLGAAASLWGGRGSNLSQHTGAGGAPGYVLLFVLFLAGACFTSAVGLVLASVGLFRRRGVKTRAVTGLVLNGFALLVSLAVLPVLSYIESLTPPR